jgi:hypothetical protein
LHDPQHLWADAYALFNSLMGLGVQQLYYKDAKPRGLSSTEQTPSKLSEQRSALSEREQLQRERTKQLLELSQEDNAKTALKRRSNYIFNVQLKEIDHELHRHVQEMDIQPELIFLRWLRCMASREFSLNSLLYVWDFIIADVPG